MEDDDAPVLEMQPETLLPRLLISGEINRATVENCIRRLELIVSTFGSQQPILVEIDSEGGYVIQGFRLYAAFQQIDNPIITYCRSEACSMGAFLFICLAPKQNRYCSPEASIMIHEGSFGAAGKVSDVRGSTEYNIQVCDRLFNMIAKGLDLEDGEELKRIIRDRQRGSDWWITGDELIENNVVEKIQYIDIVPQVSYTIRALGTSKVERLALLREAALEQAVKEEEAGEDTSIALEEEVEQEQEAEPELPPEPKKRRRRRKKTPSKDE